jgi:calcineurin-like phosphoesterase family protein
MSNEELEQFKKDPRNTHISDSSTIKMNEAIIEMVNEAEPTDTIWVVGDWSFIKDARVARNIFNKIRCMNISLVLGGHDKHYNDFKNTFSKITININGQIIVLNHEAMAIWDRRHYGAWHLYGHSHSRAEEWLNTIMPGRFSIDVGIDNALKIFGRYKMFEFEELKEIFGKRTGFGLLPKKGR